MSPGSGSSRRSRVAQRTESEGSHENRHTPRASVRDTRCHPGDPRPKGHCEILRTIHALHRRLSESCRRSIRVAHISESPSDPVCRCRREGNCNLRLAGATHIRVDWGMSTELANLFRPEPPEPGKAKTPLYRVGLSANSPSISS